MFKVKNSHFSSKTDFFCLKPSLGRDKWLRITVKFITNENKERETVKSKSFVTLIQNENNDKSYDGKCFYKHIIALLLLLLLRYLFFLCSTKKSKNKI